MTDLETSMATIIAVFQKYSEREGDKHKLKKSELKDLLHDELPDLMAVRHEEIEQREHSVMVEKVFQSFIFLKNTVEIILTASTFSVELEKNNKSTFTLVL